LKNIAQNFKPLVLAESTNFHRFWVFLPYIASQQHYNVELQTHTIL